jgi:hypothetical protein
MGSPQERERGSAHLLGGPAPGELVRGALDDLAMNGGDAPDLGKVVVVGPSGRRQRPGRELPVDEAKEISPDLRVGGVDLELQIAEIVRPLEGEHLVEEVRLPHAPGARDRHDLETGSRVPQDLPERGDLSGASHGFS